MATTEMSVAYIWYLEHTIFCFWVRSAVDVFAAWAALSFSWTSLVFGVTTEVTVGVFVLTPAGEHWLVRSWHLSAKRSSDDLTPGRNAITHTCQTQEPLPLSQMRPTKSFYVADGSKDSNWKVKKILTWTCRSRGFLGSWRANNCRLGTELWFLRAWSVVQTPRQDVTLQRALWHRRCGGCAAFLRTGRDSRALAVALLRARVEGQYLVGNFRMDCRFGGRCVHFFRAWENPLGCRRRHQK